MSAREWFSIVAGGAGLVAILGGLFAAMNEAQHRKEVRDATACELRLAVSRTAADSLRILESPAAYASASCASVLAAVEVAP